MEYIEREAFLEQEKERYCKDCARRQGMRNGKYKTLYEIGEAPCRACEIDDVLNDVEDFPAADVLPRDEAIKMGAELAAMHGSDATSQQLEEAYLKGVEYGMTRRDVRPVVACCDCKHFQVNVSPSGYLPQGVPEWECRYWCRPTDPTDFCSYGEKMEER